MNDTILAIDIGSTKICSFVAKIGTEGSPQILGHGVAKSQGVKKGVITNIELASKAIKNAITDAKRMSGSNLTTATVSISNAYAKSITSTGIVNIPHKEITVKEIQRAMQTALYNANIPNEYEVIHVLPYNFKVDEQDYIEDPYGMNAGRMEVDVNIIMMQKSNLSNLKKAVRSAGVDIGGLVLSSYASAIAVMKEDEKQMGVAVIDLGGQTSNLIVHTGNAIRYNDYLGVGSNHITNDISMALHTPLQVAEEIKRHYGIIPPQNEDESIELPIIGDEEQTHPVSLGIIHSVMHARVEETLMLLAGSLEKSGLMEQLGAGIVCTGGMTKLKGFKEFAQTMFPMLPVRIGKPQTLEGMFDEFKDPAYATAVGLLLYKAGNHIEYEIDFSQEMLHSKAEYSEDLSDLNLSAEHSKKTPAQPQESAEVSTSKRKEPSTINLDDFAVTEEEHAVSPAQKLTNWFKQLF